MDRKLNMILNTLKKESRAPENKTISNEPKDGHYLVSACNL